MTVVSFMPAAKTPKVFPTVRTCNPVQHKRAHHQLAGVEVRETELVPASISRFHNGEEQLTNINRQPLQHI
jgi:hypothetical protein